MCHHFVYSRPLNVGCIGKYWIPSSRSKRSPNANQSPLLSVDLDAVDTTKWLQNFIWRSLRTPTRYLSFPNASNILYHMSNILGFWKSSPDSFEVWLRIQKEEHVFSVRFKSRHGLFFPIFPTVAGDWDYFASRLSLWYSISMPSCRRTNAWAHLIPIQSSRYSHPPL